ncbi:hypothetical protein K438DRAFT_1936524 [Mycena galopus ATCC 62051]|nr:hypothetical protein K438DRAFT_1936524 [Mycena galopus ATCC 62051]
MSAAQRLSPFCITSRTAFAITSTRPEDSPLNAFSLPSLENHFRHSRTSGYPELGLLSINVKCMGLSLEVPVFMVASRALGATTTVSFLGFWGPAGAALGPGTSLPLRACCRGIARFGDFGALQGLFWDQEPALHSGNAVEALAVDASTGHDGLLCPVEFSQENAATNAAPFLSFWLSVARGHCNNTLLADLLLHRLSHFFIRIGGSLCRTYMSASGRHYDIFQPLQFLGSGMGVLMLNGGFEAARQWRGSAAAVRVSAASMRLNTAADGKVIPVDIA